MTQILVRQVDDDAFVEVAGPSAAGRAMEWRRQLCHCEFSADRIKVMRHYTVHDLDFADRPPGTYRGKVRAAERVQTVLDIVASAEAGSETVHSLVAQPEEEGVFALSKKQRVVVVNISEGEQMDQPHGLCESMGYYGCVLDWDGMAEYCGDLGVGEVPGGGLYIKVHAPRSVVDDLADRVLAGQVRSLRGRIAFDGFQYEMDYALGMAGPRDRVFFKDATRAALEDLRIELGGGGTMLALKRKGEVGAATLDIAGRPSALVEQQTLIAKTLKRVRGIPVVLWLIAGLLLLLLLHHAR
jgi:hypothetical protein